MLNTSDPFGGDMKTCSISGAFMADNAETLVPQGMSEAMLSGAQAKGQLGAAFAKVAKGEIKKYTKIAEGTKPDGTTFTITYVGPKTMGKKTFHSYDIAKVKPGGAPQFFGAGENSAFLQQIMDEATWKFGNASKPTVAAGPNPVKASVGAMSDEDVSTLFVVIKDKLAKEKGINIKGSNPELDALVHKEIGERVGYTAQEVSAKIDAYKATGKKLSALKKKALKDKPTIPPKPKPATKPDDLLTANDVSAHPPGMNEGAYKMLVKKIENGDVATAQNFAQNASSDSLKLAAQQALKDKGIPLEKATKVETDPYPLAKPDAVKGFESLMDNHPEEIPWVKKVAMNEGAWTPSDVQSAQKALKNKGLDWSEEPLGVPTTATKSIVEDVVEDIDSKGLMHDKYTPEDLAAQFIMAKDKVVADSGGKWTLYTKSEEMDQAIYQMIHDVTGQTPHAVKQGVKDYLASGKKLSVLKKQLVKQGAFQKKAPTLKGGTKATKANVNAFADKGFDPPGYVPAKLDEKMEGNLYQSFKTNGLANYLTSPEKQLIANMEKVQAGFAKEPYNLDLTLLDIVRAIDKAGAKKFGVTNEHLFEKKIVPWVTSPEGKAYMQSKIEAEKLKANMPPLPADSKAFDVISTHEAQAMQNRLSPWTADQKSGLRHYTGGAYDPMNRFLRGKSTHISTTDRTAISNAKLGMRAVDQQFLVRRGTAFDQFDVGSYEELVSLVGKTYADKGFLSTSVGGEAAFGGTVKMEVEVAKGTKGAYVQSISHFSNEKEFIIAPGTKMKILRVDQVGYQTVVRLRTIP